MLDIFGWKHREFCSNNQFHVPYLNLKGTRIQYDSMHENTKQKSYCICSICREIQMGFNSYWIGQLKKQRVSCFIKNSYWICQLKTRRVSCFIKNSYLICQLKMQRVSCFIKNQNWIGQLKIQRVSCSNQMNLKFPAAII